MDEATKFSREFKRFFTNTCKLASLGPEDLDIANATNENEKLCTAYAIEVILRQGLNVLQSAPVDFPKKSFATGIYQAVDGLKRAWVPWLRANSSFQIPEATRAEILRAHQEVRRQFVSIETELRLAGTMNGIDLSNVQLDESARQGIRDENSDHGKLDTTEVSRVRMTVSEAGKKARIILQANPSFARRSQREWAKEIGCSVGTVSKLPQWKATKDQRLGPNKGTGKPRIVALDERQVGTRASNRDPQLDDLIADSKRDDAEENRPQGPRAHKQLPPQ